MTQSIECAHDRVYVVHADACVLPVKLVAH